MKRRKFIQYSALSLLATGCDFEYNTNQVDTDIKDLNNKNIEFITSKALSYPITIALISDTHNFYTQLRDTINKIKSDISYDFIIHGGDITDNGFQKEFDYYHSLVNKASIPIVHSIGNHDAITNGITVFRNVYGAFDFTFQIANSHFIFFNNNNWEFGDKPLNLDWLEDRLIEAKVIIDSDGVGQIIVVNHIAYNDSDRFTPTETSRYKQLITDYNATISINGHNHNYSLRKENAIDYLTIGSVNHNSFVKMILNSPSQLDITLEKINV